jgi:hypothetical protein
VSDFSLKLPENSTDCRGIEKFQRPVQSDLQQRRHRYSLSQWSGYVWRPFVANAVTGSVVVKIAAETSN